MDNLCNCFDAEGNELLLPEEIDVLEEAEFERLAEERNEEALYFNRGF